MRYRLKNKTNISKISEISDNNCCFSQDIKDNNPIDSNLDRIIFQKMDMILNPHKNMENRIKSPKFFTPKKANHNRYNKLIINKRITLGKFLMENKIKRKMKRKTKLVKGIKKKKKLFHFLKEKNWKGKKIWNNFRKN